MQHAWLQRDGDVVTVMRDGHPQSAVSLGNPEYLEFEYVQHLALAIDALCRPGPLRVTHIGGGGLTLPRWIAHTRPGSPQIVLEPDQHLTDLVRAQLPLPRGHRIRVRAQTGEEGMAALRDASADVVVLDAFVDGRVPSGLTTVEWLGEVRRVLADGGFLLANIGDGPGLRYAARVLAGVLEVLGAAAVIGLHEVLKSRRFGNAVVIGSCRPLDLHDLRWAAARAHVPTGVLGADEVGRRVAQARPFVAADAEPSPVPPPAQLGPGRRRYRM